MKTTKTNLFLGCALGLATVLSAPAVVIIEPGNGGMLQDHFSYLPEDGFVRQSTSPGGALGLTDGVMSIFDGSAVTDEYVVRFTPGVDADNFFPSAGTDLGNGNLASGLASGPSGLYNVYATWPRSVNVSTAGADFWLVASGTSTPLFQVDGLNQNYPSPGSDIWWLAGSANLTSGVTYELHMRANDGGAYVSQRLAGVLFDCYAPIPEPTTIIAGALLLLPFGASTIRILRKRHAA